MALIRESKLSSKSKNPCIRNYATVHKDRPYGNGGRLLVFIHQSIPFSKQQSSPEALSNPHLEELSIKADIGNTKLIISNIYMPPANSCSNGYFKGDVTCECGLVTENTARMMQYTFLVRPCLLDDLNSFNGIAKKCVEWWKTQVWWHDDDDEHSPYEIPIQNSISFELEWLQTSHS